MHTTTDLLQTVVVALAAGTILLVLAAHLRIPAIVPLLLGGVLLGPEALGLVDPGALGAGLEPFVSLAVAVILFEGGMTLDLKGAKAAPRVIRRLVSVGAAITWLGTAGLAMLLLDLSLPSALLTGSLIIVTGPTVVTPLLRRIGVRERLHHVLHWEAVLIDPVGVFVALLCFEWVVRAEGYLGPVGDFALRVFSGLLLGFAGGLLFGTILEKRWLPREYINITMLAGALLLYGLADRVLPHTGILAVTVGGLVLGWIKPRALDDLKEFKLQMTELAIATVFVMLAADLELASFFRLGWAGALLVALVIVAIRPIGVLASTWDANLDLRERLFVSWIAPRGIVAASMASLFALELSRAGHQDATVVEPFTFAVIAATVLLQGSTAGLVATLLGVRRPARTGWLIVNARALGRRLASVLRTNGIPAVLVDRNAMVIDRAQSDGLEAIHADALDAELVGDPRLASIGRLLCATDNDVINEVVAKKWSHDLGSENVFAWSEVCTGKALGQQRPTGARKDALSRAERVNLGLDEGVLEISVIGPRSGPLPPGARPLFALTNASAEVVGTPTARQDARRVVLQWTRPSDRDLFQAATFMNPAPQSLEDAYRRLTTLAAERIGNIDVDDVVAGIVERERTMSMEIGNGVAIPHAYCTVASRPFCSVGIVRNGIARQELERQAVRVIFLLLSPAGKVEAHLESLATIAHWAHDTARIDSLADASSPEEVLGQLIAYVRSQSGRVG